MVINYPTVQERITEAYQIYNEYTYHCMISEHDIGDRYTPNIIFTLKKDIERIGPHEDITECLEILMESQEIRSDKTYDKNTKEEKRIKNKERFKILYSKIK